MYPLGKGEGGNGGAPEDAAGGGFVEKDNVLESGERPASSRRKAGCGAVHNGNNYAMNKRGGRERKDCFEDIRGGKRRILRSDVARLRAEAEAARKRFEGEGGHGAGAEQDDDCFEISFQNGSDWIKVGEDVQAEKEEKLESVVAKQTEESDTHMENDTEEVLLSDDQLRNNPSISKRGGEEIEAEKKWLVESCAIDHMEEAHVDEQKTAEESDTSERKAIKVAEAEKKKITEDSDSDLKVTEEAESAKRELTEVSDTSMKKAAGDIAYGAYQYESTSAIIERNGMEQIKGRDEKEVEMSRTMELDVAEADADGKEVMGYRIPEADHNANNSINKGNGIEWMKYEETSGDNKKVACLDITKGKEEDKPDRKEVGEETDTSLKKVTEENATDNNEATKESTCGADQHEKSATITGSCTEQMKCGNGFEVNEKKAMKLDVANQRGETDTVQGKVSEEAASEAQHNRERSITSKNKDVNHRIKVEMRITRSAAAKQRKEVATDERKVKEEVDADNNEAAEDFVPGADRNRNISTIRKRIGMDQIKCEGEINIENQQIVGMDASKHSEEARTGRKKVKKESGSRINAEDMEQIKHMDTKVDNKRIKGLNVARQRNKTHIISEDENQKRGVDAIKKKVMKSGLDRKRCRETSDSKTTRKKIKTESLKYGHDRTEGYSGKVFNFDSSNCRGSGPRSAVPAAGRKVDVDEKTMRRSVRGQSRGTSNKKVDGGDEENKKKRGFPMGSRRISKHHILPVKRKVLRKSYGAKMEPKSSNGKSKVMVKKESKKNTATVSEGRKEAKEKVREQIKNMLLNAGWRIDLRPRKGKNYEDSVYISPQGSGYWSITKAYEVFQKDFNHAYNEKGKDVARSSSRPSKRSSPNIEGADFPFPSIPMEDLSILKKKIVKKSKEVLKKSKKKLADGRVNKKLKEAGNTKYLKHKDNEREIKGKAKVNGTAGLRGIVGHGLKKPQSGRHKKRHGGCALLVRGSNQEGETGTDGYVSYVWKRTILSWMIDLGIVPSNGKVKYRKCTEAMLEGWITRDGIKCCCCSKIFAVSKFEIHAGSELSNPYQNIFVEETGASLCQCLLDAWKKQDDSERQGYHTVDIDGDDPNDDTCRICGDGGDLICCDGCPSTFHLNCLGFQILPPGDWHCMNCSCRFCGVPCGSDAHGNGGTVPPLLACSLCQEKYHQACAVKLDDVSVSSALSSVTFCGHSCRELFEGLKGLLGVKHDLEAGLSWTVVQRFDEDSPEPTCGLDQIAECNSKIAVALAVMNECFVPIIDKRSGIDLIHNVIYNCGSNFNRLNFRGFYTFILEHGDEIISVATLRIHGTRLAEMPFIGTRNMYRRQGMCRRLLGGIELALCSLNVEKLIIPAISELTETWINVFGFKPLEVSDKQEIKSLNMVVFPGAGLLQKPLVMGDPVQWSKTTEGVNEVVPESMHHHAPEVTNESSFCSVVESGPQAAIMVTGQCEHEIKQTETRDGCTFSPCDMSVKSSDASCGSKFEASDYKLLEASAGTKHDNNSAKIPEGGISRNSIAVNENSGEYTFDSVFVEDTAFSDSEMVAEPLNVINPLHTSLPEPNVHSDGGVMLGISHKEDDDAGHAEQHPSAFSEGPVNHALEKFKSLNAASKSDIISLGGLKSPKKVPSNLLDSSNVPTDLTSDVAHHSLQMVAKDSALIVPSITGSCAFTKNIQPDSHSMIVDNTQVVPGQLSMTEISQEQSLCAASQLVSKPLDNCLQSPNMSNLQH